MRRKKEVRVIPALQIENAGAEGRSVGRHEGKAILVDYAVPGDVADVQLTVSKKSYSVGFITQLITASPERVEPVCRHFGTCGGCKWQHINYAAQLQYKQQQVQDAFERIGHFPFPPLQPIVGSAQTTHYRNKQEYAFTDRRWLQSLDSKDELTPEQHMGLGFHVPGRWDKVLDIENCHLQNDFGNTVRLAVKKYTVENGFSYFNLYGQTGLMRQLLIRNTLQNEWMVVVSFGEDDAEKREGLMQHLRQQFPQITSLWYVINTKKNDSLYDLDMVLYAGKDHITELLEDLQFHIGPKSFFQTNSQQTLQLYRKAREFAALGGNELVYDLYTGVGTIAAFVAKQCRQVVGIEYVERSIEDARMNASLNNIDNVKFFAGDMKDVLNDTFIQEHGKPEVIITDPPRAGMHEDVVKKILDIAPQRVVYVSCNPASQARDIAWMQEHYAVTQVQPVDMFPHTHHVENVTLLERR